MNRKFKYEFEENVFKKLFSDCAVSSFTEGDFEIILNVLERDVLAIKNKVNLSYIRDEIDLSYIKISIECLKRDGRIDEWNRSGLRQNLYSIYR